LVLILWYDSQGISESGILPGDEEEPLLLANNVTMRIKVQPWDVLSRAAEAASKNGRYDQTEILLRRALAAAEKTYGRHHLQVALTCVYLADACVVQQKYLEAERLYDRAKTTYQELLGVEHINVALVWRYLADLYSLQNRSAEAQEAFERSRLIFNRQPKQR
jgi:tetratricopeptide (TPR) repeat protein